MGCLRRLFGFVAKTVFLLIVLIAALYLFLYYFIEQKLADEVRRYFLLPASADVKILYGTPIDSLNGRIREIRIKSSVAKVESVVIENLELNATEVKVNVPNILMKRSPVIEAVGEADVRFEVTLAALAEAWTERGGKLGLKEVKLSFLEENEGVEKGRNSLPVKVDATLEVLGKSYGLSLAGEFGLKDDREITFVPSSLEFGGLGISDDLLEQIVARLAPRIRLRQLQDDIVIKKLSIKATRIVVEAGVPLDELS